MMHKNLLSFIFLFSMLSCNAMEFTEMQKILTKAHLEMYAKDKDVNEMTFLGEIDAQGNIHTVDKDGTEIIKFSRTGLIKKQELQGIMTLIDPITGEESIFFNRYNNKWTTVEEDEDLVVITTTDGNKKAD